jgi:peptide deformylase
MKKVLTHPNPKLKERSVEILVAGIISERIRRLIEDLKETMFVENGVGIAAPQIGVQERLIVVGTDRGPQVFVNPKIVRKSFRKMNSEEGCLSVPGVFGIVRRHRGIVVSAYNEKAEPVTIRVENFSATLFQHEIDHLDGILFIDKVVQYTSHLKM